MVACIVMHIQHILEHLSHYFVGHMACYIAAAYSGSYRIAPSTAAHPANGDVLPNPEKAAGASDARQVVLQVHHIGSLLSAFGQGRPQASCRAVLGRGSIGRGVFGRA